MPTVTSSPAAIATPAEDPHITKIARAQYDAFAAGKIDPSQYSVDIPASAVAQVQAALTRLGPIQSVSFLKSATLASGTAYAYRFTCQKGDIIEQISIKDGKINGIYFIPPSQ